MVLGIVYHAAIPFTVTDGTRYVYDVWPVMDRSRHILVDLLVFVLHAFRMPLFFLLAGFFAHLVYGRAGLRGFLTDRSRRVLLPFIIGMLTIAPAIQVILLYASAARTSDFPENLVRAVGDYFGTAAWASNAQETAHLWFLDYLFTLYLATAVVLASRLTAGPRLRAAVGAGFRRVLSSWACPLVTTLVTMLVSTPESAADPTASILPLPSVLAYYGLYYAFGWVLYAHRDLLDGLKRRSIAYLLIALIAVFPLFFLVWPLLTGNESDTRVMSLVWLGLHALFVWLMIFGLLGLSLRLLDRPIAAVRYCSDASYWIYLAHMPLVLFLSATVANWPVSALVKLPGIVLISLGLLLLSYELVVRHTAVGHLLHGPRRGGWRGDQKLDSTNLRPTG